MAEFSKADNDPPVPMDEEITQPRKRDMFLFVITVAIVVMLMLLTAMFSYNKGEADGSKGFKEFNEFLVDKDITCIKAPA